MIQMAIASVFAAGVVVTWLPSQIDFLQRNNNDIVCAFKTGKTCVFNGVDPNYGGFDELVGSTRKKIKG